MTVTRTARALIALAMTAACAQPDEGALQPLPTPGVTLGKRSIAGDTAEIVRLGIQARVWGDWGWDAGETVDVEYRNTGGEAVSIHVDRVSITFDGNQGAAEQISDVSLVDLNDADHRNDVGRSLMEDAKAPDRPGILVIPAREARRIQVSFRPFSEPHRPRLDDVVTLKVPLSETIVSVRLKCAGP
ncbi:hypothetical protein [Sphingomonas sp. PB4P5]|uniref:hypothetical protein n=1 Tax=Parasphingomonas puruogangriensis TaxID=3096155 RepID=UPI002FC78862